jgi:hypothetical protein
MFIWWFQHGAVIAYTWDGSEWVRVVFSQVWI